MVDRLGHREEVHTKKTDKVGAATERKLPTTKIPDRDKKKNESTSSEPLKRRREKVNTKSDSLV